MLCDDLREIKDGLVKVEKPMNSDTFIKVIT